MNRGITLMVLLFLATWVVAHVLYLGPAQDATQVMMSWATGVVAASAVVAALTVLVWGLVLGGTSPAWLRFVYHARTASALLGLALVVFGLLHWRDTEPRSELHWLVMGLTVLAGAVFMHGWLAVSQRRLTR
jgi:hypothetical protein